MTMKNEEEIRAEIERLEKVIRQSFDMFTVAPTNELEKAAMEYIDNAKIRIKALKWVLSERSGT